MDYGGTNLKAGVFHESGGAEVFHELPLGNLLGRGSLIDRILDHATETARGHRLTGGGFAIKGLVDVAGGMVLEDIGAGSLLAGIDLRMALSLRLGVPFVIENDARAYALGEWRFGAGRGARCMACMTLGTGLGCAVIIGGEPYRGADTLGGLLGGHVSIDRHGPLCPCGNRGCLELYCSATAMHRRVKEENPDFKGENGDRLAEYFAAVGRGDPRVQETFRAIIDDLALGVVNIIHAYAPDVVVIGGGVMRSAAVILPPLTVQVHRMAWTFPRGKVQIRAGELGNKAAALGAAFHPALDVL
jgi:glucokinase